MQLIFNVNKQTLSRSDDEFPASGSKEYLTAKFTFSDDWNGTTKTVVFSRNSLVFNQILDENGECKVPHDIIVSNGAVISVFGTDGTKRITTTPLFVRIDSSGYIEGSTPEPPTPTVYEQIIGKLDEVKADIPDVPLWALEPDKPEYTAAEVGALPDTTIIPDVPTWALQSAKPIYTASEVGALPDTADTNFVHKSGDETISGNKTFTENVIAPNLVGGNTAYGGTIVDNLNNITKNGFYTCYGTAIGAPNTSFSWFVIHQNSNAGTTSATQRCTAYGDNSIVYERKKADGVWKDFVLQVSRSEFDGAITDLDSQLAETANNIETNYVKKNEVTTVMRPKGNIAYASLPTSGNALGDYYYCSDGDGVNPAGNYAWNGTSWYFGGTGDEGYSELKEEKVDKTDITYNVIKQLYEMVNKNKVDYNWNESYGYYFNKRTATLTPYDQMRMFSIGVSVGDVYDIKSRIGYEMALWSMHDSAGNHIQYWNDGNMNLAYQYVEDTVVIPSGVTELRVYAYVGHLSGYVKKYELSLKVSSPLNGKKWVAIGDSLTDSATLQSQTNTKNYVDYIADETGVMTVNKGVGGTGYMATNNGAGTTFYERRIELPNDADIYTIFGSFNDMNYFTDETIGTIDDSTTETLMGSMTSAIRAISYINTKAIVGVILPTPWASYNNTSEAKREKAQKYINALIHVCNKYSVPYLDLYNQSGLRPWDSNFCALYYKDDNGDGSSVEGVHPNSEGHKKFISNKVKKFLETLIG